MGRRFLLILGILLSTSAVRAQDPGEPPMPGAKPASTTDPPLPLPMPVSDDGRPLLPSSTPTPASPEEVPAPLPALEATGDAPPDDAGLSRAQATTAPPPATAADGEDLPAGSLPPGRQSVHVTVDVESPSTMNLHQPAVVRLVIHNTGTAPALRVRVRDELPDGLKFLSSEPPPAAPAQGPVLSWSLPELPAASNMVIVMKVEPVKTGELRHGASVRFLTGSGVRTKVLQPLLRIQQKASTDKVLRGQEVEFRIRVTNMGNGPAHDVRVVAKLTGGLRYGSGRRGDVEVVTDPIPVLGPNQSEELDPLIATALMEGPASCTVTASSPDVIVPGQDKGEAARDVAAVTVVEPKLTVAVSGPSRRPTQTVAAYEILVGNPGTAPAQKVRVMATVPPGLRLLAEPKGARYDEATRRLFWSIDRLENSDKPRRLSFEARVGDVGRFEVAAEAVAAGGLRIEGKPIVTDVYGMSDIRMEVSERHRVVDVNGRTSFQILLRNEGTKEASNIVLKGTVTPNLKLLGFYSTREVPEDIEVWQNGEKILFGRKGTEAPAIPRLEPGQQLAIVLEVQANGPEPQFATCHISATHDDLEGPYQDMAGVRVLGPAAAQTANAGKP